ncbi:MAG: integration/recombination/inversion protein [Cypionkella sp.]|uniref:recombinase family protein n=1 Tax=Cypionkella sp. TaxID=2811411 RepID=UPI002635A7D0|nr:recombinase family protein [Cypionkella sp.]MDB5660879.1 integration/recombination/inversion protein [Cypionkella sp.]
MKIFYRRVSSASQTFDRQDSGDCDKVFEEKISGSQATNRPALQEMISFSREGDEVVVLSIDRLARDLRDLQAIVTTLTTKGVTVSFQMEKLTFSNAATDPLSTLQLQLMGAFAEFERAIIRKRQQEGIAIAKSKGVYKGRPPTIEKSKVVELRQSGMQPTKIAREMKISRASVYRALGETA